MAIFPSTAIPSADTTFTIPYSCRLDGSSSYLENTPGGAGTEETWTFSCWHKGDTAEGIILCAGTSHSDRFQIYFDSGILSLYSSDGSNVDQLESTPKFRDESAWYHIVFAYDTTQGVEANRIKVYVNGSQITAWATANYPTLNFVPPAINSSTVHNIGRRGYTTDMYLGGYLAEIHFIDGTALTPTSFGETGDYGEWKAKKVSGLTYGTNGYYLDFADSGNLGDDESGNGDDWTENGIAASDQMLDSPTNNFATIYPLSAKSNNWTHSEGNLKVVTGSANQITNSSFAVPLTSKWYAETLMTADGGGNPMVGVCMAGVNAGSATDANVIYRHDGSTEENNSITTGYATWTTGDIIGIAIDTTATDGTITFYKNNTSIMSSTGLNTRFAGVDMMLIMQSNGTDGHTQFWNFGQDSSFAGEKTAQGNQDDNDIGDFYYTPPSGHLALCTSNLPDVAVTPSEHFNTLLYTGNGVSGRAITGVGFQPDLLWTKARSAAYSHRLSDAAMGATNSLITNSTGAIATDDVFDSLDSDGFTVGNDAGSNADTKTYVAWNWKGGGGAGSANTEGSINTTSTSANTDAGFSVSKYTSSGASSSTIGHGLTKAPELVIVKQHTDDHWAVYHHGNTDAPETDRLIFTSAATADSNLIWNDTAPSATLVTIGDDDMVNRDGGTYQMYCWHSVDGFSKVGGYTGNGAVDGTFVYTGFSPAYVLLKCTSSGENWTVHDNKRNTYNVTNTALYPNYNYADDSADAVAMDFVSNGFKFRFGDRKQNGGSATYVYLAFAETPFKYSNAR